MSHPINDLIIRVKNGYMSRRDVIESPYSTFREAIVKKLKELGYIQEYEVSGDIIKTMTITLRYEDLMPAVTDVKLYSKSGQRWYVSAHDLKPVVGGMGYSILSTPQGILTNIEARKKKVGGELLFNIW